MRAHVRWAAGISTFQTYTNAGELFHRYGIAVLDRCLLKCNGILADNFRNSIRQIDVGLLAVLDEVDRQQKAGRWDDGTVISAIERLDARHPEYLGFRIFGPDGMLRYGVSNIANPNADISQRDDFKTLRNTPDSGLFVGPPAYGTTAQQWSITLARRINNPDGSFGGIVTCAISIQALTKVFASLDLGPHGVAALHHASFQMAARFPPLGGSGNKAVMVPVGDPLRTIMATGAPATGSTFFFTLRDGGDRAA